MQDFYPNLLIYLAKLLQFIFFKHVYLYYTINTGLVKADFNWDL